MNPRAPRSLAAICLVIAFTRTLHAQDLAGIWQGTMQADKEQRIQIKIAKDPSAGWHGVLYALDSYQASTPRPTTQMSLQTGDLRFAVTPIDSSYQGKLSDDGATVTGTWTQAGTSYPLILTRVPADAAWDVPKPTALMAKDADPDWEVVSVRARDPDENNGSASITTRGRQFVLLNRTVQSMMLFGFGLHKKQILNAPDWVSTLKWDVEGVPDAPGEPSLKQMQSLTRKVLIERFGLKFHRESHDQSVYAITIAKGGPKLTRSMAAPDDNPSENDNQRAGMVSMRLTNTAMSELALAFLYFLDRPVIDQTGLTGRYDFLLKWTTDESRAPTDGTAPPGLFTAIQEQLGLKLEPVKAPAQVLIIDAIDRASAN